MRFQNIIHIRFCSRQYLSWHIENLLHTYLFTLSLNFYSEILILKLRQCVFVFDTLDIYVSVKKKKICFKCYRISIARFFYLNKIYIYILD